MMEVHKLKNIVNQERETADGHPEQIKSLIDKNVTHPPLSTIPVASPDTFGEISID